MEGPSRGGWPGLQRAPDETRGGGGREGAGEAPGTEPALGLQEGRGGGAGGANLRVALLFFFESGGSVRQARVHGLGSDHPSRFDSPKWLRRCKGPTVIRST